MVTSMHLVNIQSWKDETIEFAEDVVNVVTARSERGKTVLFKVFYQMVFPNYYKFGSRNDLIRRGCTFGEVTLTLSNFTEILFHCEHKEQWFKMKRPCDIDWVTYWQSNCPNEIINELGLVVDYELKYILNIYIKDNQYPFINTSKTWNAVLFNQVFKNEKLDTAIEKLSSEIKELSDFEKVVSQSLNYKINENRGLTYKDTQAILDSKADLEKVNELYNILDEINKITSKHEKNLEVYESLRDKVFDVVDINDIRSLVVSLNKISKIFKELEYNLTVLDKTPDNYELGDLISKIKTIYEKVNELYRKASSVEQLFMNYSKLCNEYDSIDELSEKCLQIRNIFGAVEKISKKTQDIEKSLIKYSGILGEIKTVSSELGDVKAQIKICPTCKRPL